MFLRELYINAKPIILEGGNLEVDGHQAQHLDLQTVPRSEVVHELNNLLHSINNEYAAQHQDNLWRPGLLKSQKFLSGSSLHLFNTAIPDEEFVKHKPKVGDIDTQVNKKFEGSLENFLQMHQGKQIGSATLLGYSKGNEQFSSLWELQNPPIKIQIDLEFVEYADDEPTEWAQFSHSSDWSDLTQGVKGVFHKYMMRALTSNSATEKYRARQLKKGVKIDDAPIVDKNISFAVASKQGGGMRAKYQPYIDPATGQPMIKDGIPVMLEIPPAQSHYIQSLDKQFEMLFGRAPAEEDKKLMWSFQGLIQLANKYSSDDARQQAADDFANNLYGPGAQGLYKGDPQRDQQEKGVAFHLLLGTMKMPDIAAIQNKAHNEADEYYKKYKTQSLNEEEEPQVRAQLRKGMPHLHDLKPADLLDLLDEIHDGNGNFKLQNIPLNVKVDGFGGRFGKDAEGKPFMGTSNTPPRYQASFVDYHQKKGTTDPDVLGRAKLFDDLFHEMMKAVQLVDSKLGKQFLVNKQVTCEVLFLPFATETPEGRLKFVGIHYDKLPKGVQLALVPFRVVDAASGEDLPDAHKIIEQLTKLGQQSSVMFINNRLTQNDALDVTAIVPPIENIEQIRAMLDSGKLAQKREAKEMLAPVAVALEQAIINDPNIIGKDMLGKDYEGIVINSRLGPIKVTSQEQRDVITAKNAAKQNARTERPRGPAKTAVVAVGSFVGHRGHEQLWGHTVDMANSIGGDPYLFIGNAEGKNDPIPPAVKVQTWHKLYPNYAKNISTVIQGGSLIQKIKHELINPLPGKSPRYDNIIIMVGRDREVMAQQMAAALMKAVNKFQGYEHVKVTPEITERSEELGGTGVSYSDCRNILKNPKYTPQQQLAFWEKAFDVQKLGTPWIEHLMALTRQGMGIAVTQQPKQHPVQKPSQQHPVEQPEIGEDAAGVGTITKQNSTVDVNKNTPKKNLKAFNLVKEANQRIRKMRAIEFVKEGKVTPRSPEHDAASHGASRLRDVGGYDRVYHMNRIMMAAAMADGQSTKAVDSPSETWFEKYNTAHPYTKEEDNMIRAAMKTVPTDGSHVSKFGKSTEPVDTQKISPIAKPKRNKYGV